MSVRKGAKTTQDFNPFTIIHPIRPKKFKTPYLLFFAKQMRAIKREEFVSLKGKEKLRLLA